MSDGKQGSLPVGDFCPLCKRFVRRNKDGGFRSHDAKDGTTCRATNSTLYGKKVKA